jgi:hypothetical protein
MIKYIFLHINPLLWYRGSYYLSYNGPVFDPQQDRNFSFLPGTEIRKDDRIEPQLLVPAPWLMKTGGLMPHSQGLQ